MDFFYLHKYTMGGYTVVTALYHTLAKDNVLTIIHVKANHKTKNENNIADVIQNFIWNYIQTTID